MKRSFPQFWQLGLVFIVVIGLILLAFSGYLGEVFDKSLKPLVDVQSWIATRYTAIYEFFTVPRDVASLRQRNAELEAEIAMLQTQVIQLQQQLAEAQSLYALLDFAREQPQNQYIACAVIGRDPSPFLHYIIIDHGSDDGIRYGMPVVTESGLVGRVDAVIAQAARVQLITDPAVSINVRLEKAGVEAVLSGSLTGDINLDMIPPEVAVEPGDLLLTSGLGGNYPSDVVVGQIVGLRKRENALFQSATVQPAVDFTNLKAVLVIVNFRPIDITPLISTPLP